MLPSTSRVFPNPYPLPVCCSEVSRKGRKVNAKAAKKFRLNYPQIFVHLGVFVALWFKVVKRILYEISQGSPEPRSHGVTKGHEGFGGVVLMILGLLITQSAFAQNRKLDSLYSVYKSGVPADSARVELLMAISTAEFVINIDSAKVFAERALLLSQKLHYAKGEADATLMIGKWNLEVGDLEKASANEFAALAMFEKMNDKGGQARTYAALGRLYTDQKNIDKSIYYWKKAAALNKEINNKIDLGYNYNGLGNIFLESETLDSAQHYYLAALKVREEIGHKRGISQSYCNLAALAVELKRYDESIDYYLKAKAIDEATKSTTNRALISAGIGKAYMLKGQLKKARPFMVDAFEEAKKRGRVKLLINLSVNLSKLEEQSGDFKRALEYENYRSMLKDSVFNQQKSEQMAATEAKYDADKKQQAILLLEQDSRLQSLWRNSLILGLVLTVTAAIVIFMLQRSRGRKASQLLLVQQSLNQHLTNLDQLRSRFFANISHEFRTPLTLILGPIEEKLAQQSPGSKEESVFLTIRRSANRLLELINQLLELSKLESGYMKMNPQPGNLQTSIQSIVSSFDSLADVNQVRYIKDIRLGAPALMLDNDKLEKILSNLLSNAFKFTPAGGRVEFHATSAETASATELQVIIKNTGPVIPESEVEKIFEPFQQGENVAFRGVQGTGLGLSLVKELVKLHQGNIEVKSDEAEGTQFSLRLELAHATEISSPSNHRHSQITDHRLPMGESHPGGNDPQSQMAEDGELVLVVEDNADVRTLIRHSLESHYQVIEAAHGEEGLRMALEHVPQLVVADVMMPKMNGIDLCNKIKNNEKISHIPLIMLTARADHESKLEGLKTGADDYLVKPFNSEELKARVTNLIEQRKRLANKYGQRLVVQPHEIAVSSLDEKFIIKVIQAVEAHLDDTQFSVDVLTTELGMSRTNLHRKLKAVTGYSASEFIQDFRLRRAAQLIEKKADSLSQIAYQVGFNDQSYFTKCFKKKFGVTPSEYSPSILTMA
jgi:signal transduction histidine kinase/DNA-binding response OmpR family regulator